MTNPNTPPKTINLPPIIIKPDLPLPRQPPAALQPRPGHIAKPLPWNGKIIEAGETRQLFSQRNIKHPDQVMTIIFAIATKQDSIEKAYNAHIPLLRPELDKEILQTSGFSKPASLEHYKIEKSVTDNLLQLKKTETQKNISIANIFYGRNPFNKDIKKNAVDFANIFHKSREPALTTYARWLSSVTAAYTVKILATQTKILAERSKRLTSTITTKEAEEKKKHQDTWINRYNQEKNIITHQHHLDKTTLEKRTQVELDAVDRTLGLDVNLTKESKINKIIQIIEGQVEHKRKELQQRLLILTNSSDRDIKTQDGKAFLERTQAHRLDIEASLNKELSMLNAAYEGDVLNAEISLLENQLINFVSEQEKLIEERANSGTPPLSPPNVAIGGNMTEARELKSSSNIMVGGEAFVLGIFYTKVRNKGEWDYKQHGREFEEFGNFNYGATGTAAGIPEQILLRAAGAAQSIAGTSKEEFGKWWASSPYGDDRKDQIWIKAGIKYAKTEGF